jgi:hypothetical protein
MKCKHCVNLKNEWCEKVIDSPHPDIERDCEHFRQKTNADRIRAMSDEELAEWLEEVDCYNCDCCVYQRECRLEYDEEKHDCATGRMNWLKQPYKEDK